MKICTKCKKEKSLEEFHYRDKQKGTRVSKCSTCFSQWRKDFYKKNKQYYLNLSNEAKKRKTTAGREYAVSYLQDNPCVDCGEDDIVVLDFDHVTGIKVDGVSNLILKGKSLDTIKKEVEKCEIRCANCHRRKTAKDFGHYRYGVI